MISRSIKVAFIGCSGIAVLSLGGCVTSGAAQSGVQLQRTVAKPGNTYIIQQSAVRTPGVDRLQQDRQQQQRHQQQQLARAISGKPVVHHRQPVQKQQVDEILRQQSASRAEYHARYQAKLRRQQAAPQDQPVQPPTPDRTAAVVARPAQQAPEHRQQSTGAQPRREAVRQAQQTSRQAVQAAATNNADSAAKQRQFYQARWERQQAEKRLEAKQAEQKVERVIHNAKKQIGSKYVWGGASPKTGFDCSGLVQHAMKQGADVKVPRTAAEQYRVAVKVPGQQASRGDLVFFKTRGNSVSHVGIYLGDDKFVHAPRAGSKITTSTLSGYWKQRFVGFGRIPGVCKVSV